MSTHDIATKLILIGDGAVGKTSLCAHLRTQKISGKYDLTVGLNIEVFETYLRELSSTVKLVLWDLAGQERFGCIRSEFYNGARVALIVFDLQNRGSFFDVRHWIRELKSYAPLTPFILVGNKTDVNLREVSKDEAFALASEYRAPYIETSALHGQNVNEVFQLATRIALKGTAVAY
ncbi:MAG: GTP-binding protein [Candidatus Heimdallarchaeota archaeon]|nr:GTP-binding protein [Candidatus Heimdallarchaeota archaeon]